ncbi:MAG: hypothetical protein Q9199_004458 [Rusavskia elegans]
MKLSSGHIIACLAGLSCVTAAPSDNGIAVTAQYDNLANTIVPTPLPSYRGLSYNDWSYASQQALAVGVLASQSFPNRLVAGTMATQSIAPDTPTYQAFALLGFYWGCGVRSAQPAASQPLACTLAVTGFAASTGKQVATTTLTYTPPSPVSVGTVPMDHAILPSSFNQKLGKVTFSVSNQPATAFLVDDLSYKLFAS